MNLLPMSPEEAVEALESDCGDRRLLHDVDEEVLAKEVRPAWLAIFEAVVSWAVVAEREACAQLCEDLTAIAVKGEGEVVFSTGDRLAKAIRARGDK